MQTYLWDSCVFMAFMNKESQSHDVASIQQFLDDAEARRCQLFTSSIGFAEITQGKLLDQSIGTFTEFLADLNASVVVQTANANVCEIAGRLKDIKWRKGASDKRRLTTGDAIFVATAIYLEEVLEVDMDAFHTFDEGRAPKNIEENTKAIPLIGIHEWLDGVENSDLVERLRSLNICKPIHPEPTF